MHHKMFGQNLISFLLFLNLFALNQIQSANLPKGLTEDALVEICEDLHSKAVQISKSSECSEIPEEQRVDCYPEADQVGRSDNQMACLERKCCFKESKNKKIPWCYYPSNYQAYQVIKQDDKEGDGIYIELSRKTQLPYPNLHQKVYVDVTTAGENSLRVNFNTSEMYVFVPPIELKLPKDKPKVKRQYDVKVENNIIIVTRKSSKTKIWTADLNTLVMSEQFNQIYTTISSSMVMGLGEHKDVYEKIVHDNKQYLFFNRDEVPNGGKSTYGHHAFYLNYEMNEFKKPVNAHSVFLYNTHPVELIMSSKPGLTWRTLGGSLDFIINLGPTPMEAVQQHVQMVGTPPLVPYWSLGYHLCRYGHTNLEKAKEVTKRTIEAGIPYDTMWLDIDFMQDHTMFKLNKKAFGGLKHWVDELHSKNMKFVPIVDPGLDDSYSEVEYPYYHEALKDGLFIMHENGEVLKAKVWSKSYNGWIDFSNPNVTTFWTHTLQKWQQEIGFDGLWLDMNEPAQMYDGSKDGCNWENKYEKPYYVPPSLNPKDKPLALRTACMTARHYGGKLHYDMHNLYAYYEAIETRKALVSMKKRPFIISRSTVSGFGHYGSHWTGDVFSDWADLQASVANVLEFNLFGIPVVGADICGFTGNASEELCARWSTVGAFYTFSRNHNTIGAKDQDPVAMGPVVERAARDALKIKYSLLPLLYTELFKASQDGRPVLRAMNFVFPNDKKCYGIKNQFLWADKIMIAPVLEKGVKHLQTYFPAGVWYSYPEYKLISNTETGEHKDIELPLEKIGVMARGGNILCTQEPKPTTTETRKGSFRLVVVLNSSREAHGDLYWDDGESYDIEVTKNYSFIEFNCKNNVLTNNPTKTTYEHVPNISRIDVLDIDISPSCVYVDGKLVRFETGVNRISIPVDLKMLKKFKVNWSY